MKRSSFLMALLVVWGCGGKVDSAHDDAPPSAVESAVRCDSELVDEGLLCDEPDSACEIGDAASLGCDRLVRCGRAGRWIAETTRQSCHAQPEPPTDPRCPGEAVRGSCEPLDVYCFYPSGTTCVCPDFAASGERVWKCNQNDRRCPEARPRVGRSCGPGFFSCTYRHDEEAMICSEGTWQPDCSYCSE